MIIVWLFTNDSVVSVLRKTIGLNTFIVLSNNYNLSVLNMLNNVGSVIYHVAGKSTVLSFREKKFVQYYIFIFFLKTEPWYHDSEIVL